MEYCYVDNSENIYPAYKEKIRRNADKIMNKEGRKEFAEALNAEYKKCRKSKAKQYKRLEKMPVRIYGSGDYLKTHYDWISELNFKFFIISKNLTRKDFSEEINKLLELDNLTSLVLSFDTPNMGNYQNVKDLYGQDKIKFSYTGTPEHYAMWSKSFDFNIFFNINSKKKKSREFTFENFKKTGCPPEMGAMSNLKACSKCSKCWRSSSTKKKNWNAVA